MAPVIQNYTRIRRTFRKQERILELPDLVKFQKDSYAKFLQMDVDPQDREDTGLQGVFKRIFPIEDYNNTASIDFLEYSIEPPEFTPDECVAKGITYEGTLRIKVRLIIWDKEEFDDELDEEPRREIRDFKEEEIYFGTIPLMTETGSFVINGTERVVVNQLHRSPGIFFSGEKSKSQDARKIFSARISPATGSWLDIMFDSRDIIHVRIDKRRKLPLTTFLRALGMDEKEILNTFYDVETIHAHDDEWVAEFPFEKFLGFILNFDIRHPDTGDVVLPRRTNQLGRNHIRKLLRKIPDGRRRITDEYLLGNLEFPTKILAEDVIDENTGEVIAPFNTPISKKILARIRDAGIKSFKIFYIDNLNVYPFIRQTLAADKTHSKEEALLEIYHRMRPGEPPTMETAQRFFEGLFFDPQKYDLSPVGRRKINFKFEYENNPDIRILTKEDIVNTVRYLVALREGRPGYEVDDIDHLGNRRVRSVGELVEVHFRKAMERLVRGIRERMSTATDLETLMPREIITSRTVAAALKDYFTSSQLSQFMDQTNPLSEITHKRRLSALGPGGLKREHAGFDVRDVHPTHYGRICPIETPEGPNIGLISSTATFAVVDEFGFLQSPYRRVVKEEDPNDPEKARMRITDEIVYMDAMEEGRYHITEATVPVDEHGYIIPDTVSVRYQGEVRPESTTVVEFMDVAPEQVVSVAASMIPFLEHDDANRALMGSNMQRQAVPLIQTHAPLVATGQERNVAHDSGVAVKAKRDGTVVMVDGTRIVIQPDVINPKDPHELTPDLYNLKKFQRSNQNSCYNQRPIVKVGERVKKGDVIADGAATEKGELALGQNAMVAFMPWAGYNFEDSILVNERLIKEDVFTSIHIEEFECNARETKLGPEEITREIPEVSEEALANLDDSGIIRIGTEVKPGDILVGKITPKGDQQLSPEEKLLKAIFGEKNTDVKDSSLKVPPGVNGIVIDVQVFTRKQDEKKKDPRAKRIEEEKRERLLMEQRDEIRIISNNFYLQMRRLLEGRKTGARLIDDRGKVLLPKGALLDDAALSKVPARYWSEIQIEGSDGSVEMELRRLSQARENTIHRIERKYKEKLERMLRPGDLGNAVLKKVKVYLAIKRKLSVGDKMAGRHGNKGVVSRILREEDMPYMPDGTPVDIVLNPLGVPSRMNVGQILETHLGMAAKILGKQINEYVQRHDWKADVLRHQFKKLYPAAEKFIDTLTPDDLRQWADDVAEGIHIFTPVFEGAEESEIKEWLRMAGMDESGQTVLFDGRTGDAFDRPVTVGIMYMLKLHHLVDEKIHARATGPYSLVSQQPLGGKAQFGGQRLGEMEVWALEAYGAAYALQEFLTVKSDDIKGRTDIFNAIVKGEFEAEPGLPESFRVLLKELESLCLDVELIGADDEKVQLDFFSSL